MFLFEKQRYILLTASISTFYNIKKVAIKAPPAKVFG